ncbi:MAG TPA: hypothetical protein VGG74_05685 [Kofleriaceae bacterium]
MTRGVLVLAIVLRAGVALGSGHTCHEVSPVLGYRQCGHFGSRWAHSWWQDVAFEPGLELDRLALSASDMASGTAYGATSTTSYHLRLGSGLHPLAFGPRIRVGYHGAWLTVGVEYGFGILAGAPAVVTTLDTGQTQTTTGGNFIDGAGVVGIHHRWNRIMFGGELAVGGRVIYMQPPLPAGFSGCPMATGSVCTNELDDEHVMIVPAARVEVWVDRQITLTVTAGYDLVRGGEMLTVGLGAHGEPYDGD